MIDINPESSISVSNSNSMLSKSPTSMTTATDDGVKGCVSGAATSENRSHRKCSSDALKCDDSLIVHQIGSGPSISPSEMDSRMPSISQQSATELKQICHSESNYSAQSWGSIISLDSPSEDKALEFMRRYVAVLFDDSSMLTLELKSEFGVKSRVSLIRLILATIDDVCSVPFPFFTFDRRNPADYGLHVWSVHSDHMRNVLAKIRSTR